MSTVPSIHCGAVRGPSPLVALGSDHVQELGRGGGHPRPAQPVGEHILEDPAWVAKPPGHPPGGRIDPQQDAASGCWAACLEIGRQVRYRRAAVERWSTGSIQAGSLDENR